MRSSTESVTVSALGLTIPLQSLGDSVLALAVRAYLVPSPEAESADAEGHTDHDDHSDHSDCLCVIAGL